MTARTRIRVVVAACALAAAGVAVGAAAIQSSKGDHATLATSKPRPGYPPLALDLGLRTDSEAVALRRAQQLYDAKQYVAAAAIFDADPSVEGRVGAAFAAWPRNGLRSIEQLGLEDSGSALVQLHLGLARYWAGEGATAVEALQAAIRVEPDSLSAISAGDLLHPRYARGLPQFVPSFAPPVDVSGLAPERQLAVLEQRADRAGATAHDKVIYGIALQRLGKPVSAEREFAAAARLAPADPDARVAAAVGLFSKDRPALAFSRLGPLALRFPRAATVRFHLGLMLLWLGQVTEAKKQFGLAAAIQPPSTISRQAALYLQRITAALRH